MEYKRDVRGMSRRKKMNKVERTLKGVSKRLRPIHWLFIIIGLLCFMVALYFMTDKFSNPEIDALSTDIITSQHAKHLVVAENSATKGKDAASSPEQNTQNGSLSTDKIGNYSIEYYVMFPLYEGTAYSINGNATKSDGGFGPLQQTHSGLATSVDRMYDSDPVYFSWLAPFSNNPLSYLKSCQGNDHATHSWTKCRTYWDGSVRLRDTIKEHTQTPQDMKRYYDAYMASAEPEYLVPALTKLSSLTGKKESDLGPGTVATLFAVYVRYGLKSWPTDGITANMTEDEIIDRISDNAVARASAVDKPRFKCQRSVAKAMNAHAIDIYGSYACDGSCGTSHATDTGKTFGALFGKEGY